MGMNTKSKTKRRNKAKRAVKRHTAGKRKQPVVVSPADQTLEPAQPVAAAPVAEAELSPDTVIADSVEQANVNNDDGGDAHAPAVSPQP